MTLRAALRTERDSKVPDRTPSHDRVRKGRASRPYECSRRAACLMPSSSQKAMTSTGFCSSAVRSPS